MKRFLPLFVVLGGFAAAALLIATGPQVQPQAAQSVPPLVRILTVQPGTHQFSVRTHGSVVPRTESELVPEVDGRVLRVSAALVSGGFFSKNDVLLEIDSLDYDVALEQARAGMARAESDLDNERKDHERQEDLVTKGSISASQLDNSLNRVTIAKATLREARARLARAERDLARTSITAPYDGRVRSERVDAGQFVRRGEAIGTIYAVDFAEVRLPIHANELAYLDLPISKAGQAFATQSEVTLSAEFAGTVHYWQGKVVRTEGELDPMTRMVHVVARIANPYDSRQERAPLAVGLFVDATIHGKTISNATVLPRSALRQGNQVLVVDEQDRLRFRTVNVLRLVDDQVYIGEGLAGGERVCVSALQSTADGMLVRVVKDATPS
jgi:RND family efflux transporter MFP subunit|tara:strand:+ start:1021 stop:2172 length:1152 start_codon:yes stop_codon:yes gene_type:complete